LIPTARVTPSPRLEHLMARPDLDLDQDAFDSQDRAEVLDETHLTEDGDEVATLEEAPDAYDVTEADDDTDEDDDTARDESEFDETDLDEDVDADSVESGEDDFTNFQSRRLSDEQLDKLGYDGQRDPKP
jgi:hypothetical protein